MLFRNQTRWWCTALLCVSSLHLSGCHPSTLHHLNLLMQSHSCVHSPEGHRAHHEPTSYVRGPIQSGRAEFWWWPHGKSWPGFGVWRRGDARPRRRDGDGAGSSLCWGIAASSRLERLEGGWRCCQVTWGYQQPKHIPISAVRHKINIWFIRGGERLDPSPIITSYLLDCIDHARGGCCLLRKHGSYCCGYRRHERQIWTPSAVNRRLPLRLGWWDSSSPPHGCEKTQSSAQRGAAHRQLQRSLSRLVLLFQEGGTCVKYTT